MSTGAALVRRHYELLSDPDWDEWKRVLHPDLVLHHASFCDVTGRDAYFEAIRLYRASFPDLRVAVHRVIASGDEAAADFTSSATFCQPYLGFEPTGRPWALRGMGFHRIEGGRIAELHLVEDVGTWIQRIRG